MVIFNEFHLTLIVSIAMCLFFTLKITSSDPLTAAKWFGAFTGFLVIYCGCLMPGAVTASEKSSDRIIQIVLAGVYVPLAYQALSEIRSFLSKREKVRSSEPA